MDATLSTAAVREDIEAGFKEGKERVKEFRDIVKKENDRWRAEKKAFEEKETDKAGEKEVSLTLSLECDGDD